MNSLKSPQIGLNDDLRQTVCDELEKLLASTYVLYYKTQACHWNVLSPAFFTFHAFFETQYKGLAEAVDEIAERMRMLGHFPPMNLEDLLSASFLDSSESINEAQAMLTMLLEDHERIIQQLRIMSVDSINDEGTTDFLVQRLREHEKTAWMLRSGL